MTVSPGHQPPGNMPALEADVSCPEHPTGEVEPLNRRRTKFRCVTGSHIFVATPPATAAADKRDPHTGAV